MLPNAGDELQGIKKGVLEVADLIAVNKADVADALIEAERRVRNGTEPAPVAAAAVWDRYTGRDDRAGHPVR
jgi:putative protein kinase ArgK-like GTPase of G3E family